MLNSRILRSHGVRAKVRSLSDCPFSFTTSPPWQNPYKNWDRSRARVKGITVFPYNNWPRNIVSTFSFASSVAFYLGTPGLKRMIKTEKFVHPKRARDLTTEDRLAADFPTRWGG